VRTSAVQVVATATLAALVAGGGFGRYIVDGLAQQDYTKLIGGAILVAVLALGTEGALWSLERLLVPRGIRLLRARNARAVVAYKAA
jgi:osmoprotectant transport system permease protein